MNTATQKVVKIQRTEADGVRMASASAIKMRCGDCVFIKAGQAHPLYGQSCTERGIVEKAYAPSCFTPDVSEVSKIGCDALEGIGLTVSMASAKQARIIMAMFRAQAKLAEKGLYLMQKLYFSTSVTGDDFLSTYVCGYALGVGLEGEILLASSPVLGEIKNSFTASISPSSLVDDLTFADIKAKLIEQGRVYPPEASEADRSLVTEEDYEVPSIEMTDDLVQALNSHRSKRKSPVKNSVQAKQRGANKVEPNARRTTATSHVTAETISLDGLLKAKK
jgi:hypothetical protein